MSESVTDKSPAPVARDEVLRKLRRAWRKERRFHHFRGVGHVVVWLVAMVLLDFVVDWQFRLPGWGRPILLAMNVVALGAVCWRSWWRHLRRYDPVRVALEVEGRHPELRSLLVSYVQMGPDSPQAAAASPALVRALRRQAVETTRPMDFREIVSYGQLKRIAAVSLTTMLFFAAVSTNWSELFSTLLTRMLNPGADVSYPTRTQIVAVTGDKYARQGDTVQLSATCAGLIPRRAGLFVRSEGGDWSELAMAKTAADRFGIDLPEVFQSFEYRVRAGDDESPVHRVTVLPAPQIVSAAVHVSYPAYTGLSDETLSSLNMEVPAGSALTWDLLLDQPLTKAEIIKGTGSLSAPSAENVPVPGPGDRGQSPSSQTARKSGTVPQVAEMAVSDGGRRVQWTTTASESFPYRFRWTEAVQGYAYDADVRYRVQVRLDRAPEVEIVFPLIDQKATVRKTLTVGFRARDDYKVAEAFLAWSVNGRPEQLRPLAIAPTAEVVGETTWRLRDSIPQLAEGDTITYAVEVADNRAEGGAAGDAEKADAPTPQRRRSGSRQVAIVSVPEYLAWMAERNASLAEEIVSMRDQETEASRQVGEIRDQTGGAATRPAGP